MKCPKCKAENPVDSRFCNRCGEPLYSFRKTSLSQTKTFKMPLKEVTKDRTLAGRYRIVEELGRGGMGIVYKAEDTKLKRTVALKFLLPHIFRGGEEKDRFLREAQVAASLVHPNITTIYEFDEWEDESFIVMEYVKGQTLDQLLKEGPFAANQSTEYTISIADALSLAHRKGIVHRDIKPHNIMVTSEGPGQVDGQIKIMDFGLAKLIEGAKLTLTGTRMGTAAYMSPEQAQGQPVDHRSDIFSLGALFYEMLAGSPPFGAENETAILYKIVHEEPESISRKRGEIQEDLEKVVFKALKKEPRQRYQSMGELLADLANYQYQPQTLALKTGPERKSIAVLPFEDISPGRQNEYLADGMTEELIMALSQNKQLRVIARTSVMQYKGQARDVRDISRELGVSYVLEGSVRRHEDQLRVTAQLIDARDGSHLWADKFDGVMKDIFSFQEEVAKKVTGALDVELGETEREIVTKPAPQTKAYECYLQGKFLQDVPTLPNLDRSVVMLERALKMDPQYADAYGSLANAYMWYVDTGLRPDPKYISKAEEAALKALVLDKSQPDAIFILANLAAKKADIEEAFKGFKKVLKTDPYHREALLWRAVFLYMSSCFEKALEEADKLLAHDPFWPMAHWLHSTIRLHQGMFDAAMAEYEQVVVEVPSKLVWLALAYRYADRIEKAWEAAKKVKELEPDGILWPLAFAFLEGAEGKSKEILKYIDERIKTFGWNFHIVCYWIASIYALAGGRDECFRWLERGIELGNRNYRWFTIDPNLIGVRGDPRFTEIIKTARIAAQKLES